jgi:uncharacterized protein (DUF58 family)
MTFLLKPVYWSYRWSSGLSFWAVRRFTKAGLCVACGWILAAAVGVDIENTVTYQSFALLFAFLIFSISSSFFFRGKFTASRTLPRFGTAGEMLHYEVRVTNLGAKPQVGLTVLDDLADPRPDFNQWLAFKMAENRRIRPFGLMERQERSPFRRAKSRPAPLPPVPAHGEASATMTVLPLRRGVLRFSGVTVACADPLCLFRSFSRVVAPQSVLILPKRYPLPPIALPGQAKLQEGGVALAANIGCSEEFVSLREYRRGDPLRHIHWRSWARIGIPIVKEFEDEFFVRHALVLDTFTEEPQSEIFEEAVAVAASFACTVLTQESLLDLLFVGNKSYCFTAGRSLGTADQMLEILASARNCADKPFDTLEHLVLEHIAAVSSCICVLQKWDEARRQFVKKLKLLSVPVMVLVIVPPGGQTGPNDKPDEENDGTLYYLEVGKITEGLSQLK